jgi:ABC-type uncharacterized transport system auxiliary subunit
MPETRIFSLYVPIEKLKMEEIKTDAPISLIVHSPRYLTQPYIIYRKSPYELEISKYSKWDVSPNERVRELFKEVLTSKGMFKEVRTSNRILEGFYTLKIDLKKFERSEEENNFFADLLFEATLISPDVKELYRETISKRSKLDDRSFLSLAKGLSVDLEEGIEDVMKNLTKSLRMSHR